MKTAIGHIIFFLHLRANVYILDTFNGLNNLLEETLHSFSPYGEISHSLENQLEIRGILFRLVDCDLNQLSL